MRRIVLLTAISAIVATATTFLLVQSVKTDDNLQPAIATRNPSLPPGSAAPSAPSNFTGGPSGAISALGFSPRPLQQRFLILSQQKARMLTEGQLQKAITELERELNGLNANVQLQEATKFLNEIIEKYNGTEAAKTARAALDVMENQHTWRPDDNAGPHHDKKGL